MPNPSKLNSTLRPMKKDDNQRLIIYQAFPRLLTNSNPACIPGGTLEQNGSGKLNQITDRVLLSLKSLGVNCLWLTGIPEMATKTDFSRYNIDIDNPNVVKGEAGSPYSIKDYYDIATSLAENVEDRMGEFERLVDRIHKSGMKVIIDFVPNHTARRYHSDVAPIGVRDFGENDDFTMSFARNNNYYYITNQQFAPLFDINSEGPEPYVEFPAKATGNDCFSAFCSEYDWYETVKLNYGHDYSNGSDHFDPIPDTWLKMLHVLRFWASKGIDGFRCDMVFMVPQAFWHWAIPLVRTDYPDIIFIGEIYDVCLYRQFFDYCGFDYLYDKVNLYDTLTGIARSNYSAAQLTGCWQTVDGINDKMLNFLENHDEVRFASSEFCGDPAKVVPYLVVSSMISKGPYMIYYGQELGEPAQDNEGFAGFNNRTTIFDYWSVDTLRRWYNEGKCDDSKLTPHEKWLRGLYQKVLTLCNSSDALRIGNFFDLMYVNLNNPEFNPHSCFTFMRYTKEECLLIVANFSDDKESVSINIPDACCRLTGIADGEYKACDLISGKQYALSVNNGRTSRIEIAGNNALTLKLEKNKIK